MESNPGDGVGDVGIGQNTKKTAKIASTCLKMAMILSIFGKIGEVQCGTGFI